MLSVVIITHNEAHNIEACVRSARLVTDDVVVVDSGSSDDTVVLARAAGARTFSVEWTGYGYSRNYGAEKAKYSWILALDADERLTPELAASIGRYSLNDPKTIVRFQRRNFLGNEPLRFGTLGFEKVGRIYHRGHHAWDLSLVHEKLQGEGSRRVTLSGSVLHFGLKNEEDYRFKAVRYARLSAAKYRHEGRRAGCLKRIGSPLFNSIKSYLFQFGFLDGRKGWTMATVIFQYSWLKYQFLRELQSACAPKLEIREVRTKLEVRA